VAKDDKVYPLAKAALVEAGWEVTHDPYVIRRDGHLFKIDLGLTKENHKICVEIKSFLGKSFIEDFHNAMGQYRNYKLSLSRKEPDRVLWLAIPDSVYRKRFGNLLIEELVTYNEVNIITFNTNPQLIKPIAWMQQ
jgi:hypothetical protein